jgi:hypothetical protein
VGEDQEIDKLVEATEEPGMDAVRGTMGLGALGSVIRARRRKTITERAASIRSRNSAGSIRGPQSNGTTPVPSSQSVPQIQVDSNGKEEARPTPRYDGIPSEELLDPAHRWLQAERPRPAHTPSEKDEKGSIKS